MQTPTEDDWKDFLQHPCVGWMRHVLGERRERYRREWEGGSVSSIAYQEYAIRNAAAIGECRGLAFAQELDYESFFSEIEDGKQERAGGEGASGVS